MQLRRQISRLCPHKALGDDSIPNVVLKEAVDLILPYLIQIFRVVFKLGTLEWNSRYQEWYMQAEFQCSYSLQLLLGNQ